MYEAESVSFRFAQIFIVPGVVYITYNIGTWDLPDIYIIRYVST